MLSVVLVGVFCSRVKDSKLKLSRSKLWISLLVTLGIVMFNEFGVTDGGANDKAISWISCTLLVISLIGDGILADLQAQIKA